MAKKIPVLKKLIHRINGIDLKKFLFFIVVASFAQTANSQKKTSIYKPLIDGEWHSITNQPDLGQYTSPKQQPVDFGVWKAADGTWQLWSCIRLTKMSGKTRLFYRWEGKSLADTSWKPMGIAMVADTTLNEEQGGLQAPYVFKEKGTYYMFYGDWNNICLATSKDGKVFKRVINEHGNAALFTGPLYNTRDAMVLKIADTYYCYYCGHNEKDNKGTEAQSAVFCRTSKNMKDWSAPVIVSRGGSVMKQTAWYGGESECPFVLKLDNKYVLFRNQVYGEKNLNTQYCSTDPLNFGDNNDDFLVGQLFVAAPEIIKEGNQYYIVSLKTGLDGMKIAKLKFVKEFK